MHRRALLKHSLMVAIFGALETSLQSAAIASEGSQLRSHWGYVGAESSDHWGELAQDYRLCATGVGQSPIDLHTAVKSELDQLDFSYHTTPLKILHNGHTVQINYASGSTLQLDGEAYELLQFHFHEPSEHTVDHQRFAMEIHLVHRHPQTKRFAIVGVLIKAGAAHPAIATIWEHMPLKQTPEATISQVAINAAQLLPTQSAHFYHYQGSLTTPPCSETVDWIVLSQPIEASPSQIARFIAAVGDNARPVQPLNQRMLLFK